MISSVLPGVSLADRIKAAALSVVAYLRLVVESVHTGISVNRQYLAMIEANRSKPAAQRQTYAEICRQAVETGIYKPAS